MAKHSLRNFFRKLFVALNVTIGICFILSCYATELNQGDYWFTGLFPLGGIYFLATLIVFIFPSIKTVLLEVVSRYAPPRF